MAIPNISNILEVVGTEQSQIKVIRISDTKSAVVYFLNADSKYHVRIATFLSGTLTLGSDNVINNTYATSDFDAIALTENMMLITWTDDGVISISVIIISGNSATESNYTHSEISSSGKVLIERVSDTSAVFVYRTSVSVTKVSVVTFNGTTPTFDTEQTLDGIYTSTLQNISASPDNSKFYVSCVDSANDSRVLFFTLSGTIVGNSVDLEYSTEYISYMSVKAVDNDKFVLMWIDPSRGYDSYVTLYDTSTESSILQVDEQEFYTNQAWGPPTAIRYNDTKLDVYGAFLTNYYPTIRNIDIDGNSVTLGDTTIVSTINADLINGIELTETSSIVIFRADDQPRQLYVAGLSYNQSPTIPTILYNTTELSQIQGAPTNIKSSGADFTLFATDPEAGTLNYKVDIYDVEAESYVYNGIYSTSDIVVIGSGVFESHKTYKIEGWVKDDADAETQSLDYFVYAQSIYTIQVSENITASENDIIYPMNFKTLVNGVEATLEYYDSVNNQYDFNIENVNSDSVSVKIKGKDVTLDNMLFAIS